MYTNFNSYFWAFVVGKSEVVYHAFENKGQAGLKVLAMSSSLLAQETGITVRMTPGEIESFHQSNHPELKCTIQL